MRIFRDLYSHRELIYYLALKDLKVRYKSAALGFLWILLNPLLLMVIFTVVFSYIVKIKVDDYPVFLLTALFPWHFFSHALSTSTHSIIDNAQLVKKVYFPREVIPVAINLANLINFLLTLVVLFVFLIFWGVIPSSTALLLPIAVCLQILLNVGLSLLMSGLNVYYRDVKYIIDALLMIWFYATPIFYPITSVPEWLRGIYMLNPMAGIIIFYRSILLDGNLPAPGLTIQTGVIVLLIFVIGVIVFRRYEPLFADIV